MRSSSIRKRVYGLIRTTFSQASSADGVRTTGNSEPEKAKEVGSDHPSSPSSSNSFISQCILNGRNGHKNEAEIYSGKTGLDLPVLMLETLSPRVRAAFTGPDGGLTEVGGMRRQPIVNMANLDDELSLSFDGESLDDYAEAQEESGKSRSGVQQSSSGLLGSCSSLIRAVTPGAETPHVDTDSYDWCSFDEDRCFGMSKSLYERNPLTGVNAGNPIADVFGVVARENNVIMALADGVNWGEGSRLAARCAIRGAIDHLNYHLFSEPCKTTTEIFHVLLGAFHSGHALILQEGGTLTTLCVAVAVQLRQSDTWVLCVCNVGDSLCFVYNPLAGVREVTVASHDICQMRDMRDAGGALGPVDGTNPQLHNLTCSMTFVEPDDVIFITSDGVSDNFDPVVGKFCVIKKVDSDNKENNNGLVKPVSISVGADDSKRDSDFARTRTCNASLPCVDAEQRHELMLLRMGDIVSNGILPPSARSKSSPAHHLPVGGVTISARQLCHNLIQFAEQLSMAKRRTLEDPELYRSEKRLSKSEQRNRRKMVRCKLSEMPGKLDHATVVAFKVGIWTTEEHDVELTNGGGDMTPHQESNLPGETTLTVEFETVGQSGEQLAEPTIEVTEEVLCDVNFAVQNDYAAKAEEILIARCNGTERISLSVNLDNPLSEVVHETPEATQKNLNIRARSPYEETPVIWREEEPAKSRKKHPRGSVGRHTLSVDVAWLKKFVLSRNSTNGTIVEETCPSRHSLVQEEKAGRSQSASIRQRLRGLMGSAKNIRQSSAGRSLQSSSLPPKHSSSANSSPKKHTKVL